MQKKRIIRKKVDPEIYGIVNPEIDELFKNKINTKQWILDHTWLSVPLLYGHIMYNELTIEKLSNMIHQYETINNFIIKPIIGYNGKGVFILHERENHYIEPDGGEYNIISLYNEIMKLPFMKLPGNGIMIEERLRSHESLSVFNKYDTICDFRFYFMKNDLIDACIRIPSLKSKGYANFRRGADFIGLGSDLQIRKSNYFSNHGTKLSDGREFDGMKLPNCFKCAINKIFEIPCELNEPMMTVDGTINKDCDFVVTELTRVPDLIGLNRDLWIQTMGKM